MKDPKSWKMPNWMEDMIPSLITNGLENREEIEELVNGEFDIGVNPISFVTRQILIQQITLLERLYNNNFLKLPVKH